MQIYNMFLLASFSDFGLKIKLNNEANYFLVR
jgi:hypothetical protein